MRETFFHGLSICAAIALIASLLISIILEDRSCRKELRREINSKIAEDYEYILNSQKTADFFKNINVINAEIDALVVTKLIKNDPSFLDPSRLEALAEELRFSSIVLINGDGTVEGSWPEKIVGKNVLNNKRLERLARFFNSPIPRIGPRVDVIPDSETSDSANLYVSALRQDKEGLAIIGLNNLFKLSNTLVAHASRSINERISHGGRLYFLPKEEAPGLNKADINDSRDEITQIESLPLDKIFVSLLNQRLNFIYARETPLGRFVAQVPCAEMLKSKSLELTLICFCNFIVFLAIFLLVSFFVQFCFVDSIQLVNHSLHKITVGDLDEKVDVQASKEFVELSNGVNSTVDSLKEAAAEVKRSTEEEISLAGKIQSASLPKLDEIYARHERFDVYAEARLFASVGGDMYDFFFVDDYTICFYIADVSGRGVAASLVMMKTMALFKNFALMGHELETVATLVNHYLADGKGSPFVSGVFFALNLKTCELKYVNAGHVSPISRKRGEKFSQIELEAQLILGLDPNLTYVGSVMRLEPGDDLLLYTDGVINSLNTTAQRYFSSFGILDSLNNLPENASSKDYVTTFLDATSKNPNRDIHEDVAALCFRFLSKQ